MDTHWINRAKGRRIGQNAASVSELMRVSPTMAKYIAPVKDDKDVPDKPSRHEEHIIAAATHLAHAIAVQHMGLFESDGMHGDPVELAKTELLGILSDVYSIATLEGQDYRYYDFDNKEFCCTEDIFETRVSRDIAKFIGELTLYVDRRNRKPAYSEGGGRME
jgi:hypothetical protein